MYSRSWTEHSTPRKLHISTLERFGLGGTRQAFQVEYVGLLSEVVGGSWEGKSCKISQNIFMCISFLKLV